MHSELKADTVRSVSFPVAELEIYHSRPIAPTRRIALGSRNLPAGSGTDRAVPGPGGVLLAGIVAHTAPSVAPELREGLMMVIDRLGHGLRVVQPVVRHRFQTDQIGLTMSRQSLVADGSSLSFEFDDENARPVQLALGAVYAAASLPLASRKPIFEAFDAALVWDRPVDSRFIALVLGGATIDVSSFAAANIQAWQDPLGWAINVLDLEGDSDNVPSKRTIQRRFRSLLRDAHPDHGGHDEQAAARISELSEARRILLAINSGKS